MRGFGTVIFYFELNGKIPEIGIGIWNPRKNSEKNPWESGNFLNFGFFIPGIFNNRDITRISYPRDRDFFSSDGI